jgi:hypothetical protein
MSRMLVWTEVLPDLYECAIVENEIYLRIAPSQHQSHPYRLIKVFRGSSRHNALNNLVVGSFQTVEKAKHYAEEVW